jgi:uncharacterized protein YoaH (UPF0181 family)
MSSHPSRLRPKGTPTAPHLIGNHQQRVAVQHLRGLIAAGMKSGAPLAVDKAYWATKRRQLLS